MTDAGFYFGTQLVATKSNSEALGPTWGVLLCSQLLSFCFFGLAKVQIFPLLCSLARLVRPKSKKYLVH